MPFASILTIILTSMCARGVFPNPTCATKGAAKKRVLLIRGTNSRRSRSPVFRSSRRRQTWNEAGNNILLKKRCSIKSNLSLRKLININHCSGTNHGWKSSILFPRNPKDILSIRRSIHKRTLDSTNNSNGMEP